MADLPASYQADSPELKLWRSALAIFLRDAQLHLLGNGKGRHNKQDQRLAFNDLCACGEMTRWFCSFTGNNPVWLSEKFRKYVQDYYGRE